MPILTDQDDTQVLDFDSPHSGDGDGFMGGETLPLDYGETQRVNGCDDQLGEEVQYWGKTQVIDEFEETEVVRDDDEDGGGQSERAELVVDEEGLADDFGGEVESGVRTKDANLVDPDASTDEEEGCGSDEPGYEIPGKVSEEFGINVVDELAPNTILIDIDELENVEELRTKRAHAHLGDDYEKTFEVMTYIPPLVSIEY